MKNADRKRGGTPKRPSRVFTGADVAILFELPLWTGVAWAAPESWWRRYARSRARLQGVLHGAGSRELVERVRLVDGVPPDSADSVIRQYHATRTLNRLQALRVHRPGEWRPAVSVEGLSHIDQGLERGRGVVLWVADFAFHRLVLKLALHRAGYAVSHLSGPRHGWSSSRFARRTLNGIQIGAELRFLDERVVMSDLDLPTAHRVVGAMRELRRRLRNNGVVSVSALTSNWGPLIFPFSRGRIRLAGGPPSLSHASGAPLLPVFCVRDGTAGYRVVVEPPIRVDAGLDRADAVRAAAAAYVDHLERYVVRYPGQWLGWRHLAPGDPRTPPSASEAATSPG